MAVQQVMIKRCCISQWKQIFRTISSHSNKSLNYNIISDIFANKKVSTTCTIKGWVKNIRKQKEFVFVDVNDGSCPKHLQVILQSSQKPNELSSGSSVIVEGQLVPSPLPNQPFELKAEKIDVIGHCSVTGTYPFSARKSYSPEYVRQFLHFRHRTNTFSSLLRIRSKLVELFHSYFSEHDFICIHTPLLTASDCEGSGEVFLVKPASQKLCRQMKRENLQDEETFFDKKTFLTVSGQLHLEAIASGMSRVYCFGPTFRAENSRSRRHLSEFYMIEAEIGFVDSLDVILEFMEHMIKTITSRLLNHCADDVDYLEKLQKKDIEKRLLQLIDSPFSVITYCEALDRLEKSGHSFQSAPRRGEGLGREHELWLVDHCGGKPVFVIDWPSGCKAFYMRKLQNNPDLVSAVDLLVPDVGELCGGSLRESNSDELMKQLESTHLTKSLQWYHELRQYGCVPTGGFGMGFERYLQFVLGIPNIKDTLPFPRWPHNCNM